MNWKYWQKFSTKQSQTAARRLAAPTTIPEVVARYMVVDLKKEAEWVWYLRAVERSCSESKHLFDARIFEADKTISAKVSVRDYDSLKNHPKLIVLQCRYNRKTGDVHIDQSHEQQMKVA